MLEIITRFLCRRAGFIPVPVSWVEEYRSMASECDQIADSCKHPLMTAKEAEWKDKADTYRTFSRKLQLERDLS